MFWGVGESVARDHGHFYGSQLVLVVGTKSRETRQTNMRFGGKVATEKSNEFESERL